MARKSGSKVRILDLFLGNLGRILQSQDIQDASGGAVEWARRLRELRSEGWRILTNHDRAGPTSNRGSISRKTRRHLKNTVLSGPYPDACGRKSLSETASLAKCVESTQAILWMMADRPGCMLDTSMTARTVARTNCRTFAHCAATAIRAPRILSRSRLAGPGC